MATQRTWNGPTIKRQVADATVAGLTATAAACVGPAQTFSAPRRTGNLANNITFKPAERRGNRVTAELQSNAAYAIYIEVGTRFIPARFYMRRAIDQEATKERIVARIKGYAR